VEMQRPEEEFWRSTMYKVNTWIDKHMEYKYGKKGYTPDAGVKQMNSLKDIPGWR